MPRPVAIDAAAGRQAGWKPNPRATRRSRRRRRRRPDPRGLAAGARAPASISAGRGSSSSATSTRYRRRRRFHRPVQGAGRRPVDAGRRAWSARRGDRAVVDPGARRDLAQSLGEGVAAHAAAVAARMPGAEIVVQLDEPSVPAVLHGWPADGQRLRQAGCRRGARSSSRSWPPSSAASAGRWWCTAARRACRWTSSVPPVPPAVSFDLGLVQDLDAVGTAIEAGTHLVPRRRPRYRRDRCPPRRRPRPGCRPGGGSSASPAEQLPAAVTLTPSCGLAGATPAYARAAMAHVREAAKYLQPD